MSTSSRVRPYPSFDSRPDLPIALVVGAGGLSMTLAQRLGQGRRIILASLHADELAAGKQRLHEMGVVCETIVCNIVDQDSVRALAESIASIGQLDALAHVAALSPTAGDWRKIVSVNLIGATRVAEAVLPLMREGGAAVFISSLSAHVTEADKELQAILDAPLAPDFLSRMEAVRSMQPGLAYGLSKVAINRMVRRLAKAWGEHRVRIVSVSPGLIDTPMGAEENSEASRDSKAALRRRIPLGRDGSMGDIADAVEFLLSARAAYINGIDLLVDGGLAGALLSDEK